MSKQESTCQCLFQKKIHPVKIVTHFDNVFEERTPVILRGQYIGDVTEKWSSVEYLAEKGGAKPVKIHVSPIPQMDFINKNFAYKSLPFNEFVRRAAEDTHKEFFISETEKYYLRALGDDVRKEVADISVQFPELAQDLVIPDLFPRDRFFSSVFRIASRGLQLWTHYDVMDNILIQISGRKKVVLFDPADAHNLYLNGDKSEVLDIDHPDSEKYPKFYSAIRYEGQLEPGDILFIPALWFHNVVSLDFGVAVNVFWKHLEDKMYDNKDIYGNKDLQPAVRAMQIADRAIKALEELPPVYRDFYARRLVSKIENKCYIKSDVT
ncbi:tRNA wybutosine-synthesizing protein 5-like [Saccostrea echinata]|uniref:tRNA wybutosine-synthesizing protein 5-like n=1 Tax=Saccostrea echinata TaxID=191078 RepID=UPI002A80DFBA|nr:tRNA wybutosine-synthesizing protein 5-like [Saccostrea echinata]